jgi:hypothetical protein
MKTPPRFAIINTTDAPCRLMVCEWVTGYGYCYMARSIEKHGHLKDYDGMRPSLETTSMEDFGFAVNVGEKSVVFTRVKPSMATYSDGMPRDWQDRIWNETFELPLVTGKIKKRRSA